MLLPCFLKITSTKQEPNDEEQNDDTQNKKEETPALKALQEEDKGEEDQPEDKPNDKTGMDLTLKREWVPEDDSKRSLFFGHVEHEEKRRKDVHDEMESVARFSAKRIFKRKERIKEFID